MTPNELMNLYILARIIGWRHELELLDAEAVAELIKALRSANNLLRARLEAELPQVWDSYTAEKGGAAVRLWLGELLTDPATQVENTITEAWSISAQSSLAAYNDILSFNGLAKNVVTVPITVETIKNLASRKLFAGQSLAQLIGKAFSEGQISTVIQSLDKGIANGWSYPKVIKDLTKSALDQGFEITQRESITLARSYIQQASVNAQLAVYERNKKIIKGVKWCAILDNKICALCSASDGLTYTWEEEKPPMPRHLRCRCLWLPWLKSWRDVGIDADELEQAARPWLVREEGNIDAGGRKVLYAGTSKEDFPGWWKTLPYKEQIKSIGPVRTQLINSGQLTWKDLMNKNTGRFYTLAELGFDERGQKL